MSSKGKSGIVFFCISSPQFAAPSPRKVIVFLLSSKSRYMPPHVRICNFGNLSRSERAREKEWGEFFLIQRWEILWDSRLLVSHIALRSTTVHLVNALEIDAPKMLIFNAPSSLHTTEGGKGRTAQTFF